MHALHLQELNDVWETDRRIPTVSSRRKWAEARNLNPINVHNWWYRRKKIAKKFRIRIPAGVYELDVGVPPEIPEPEPTLEEVHSSALASEASGVFSGKIIQAHAPYIVRTDLGPRLHGPRLEGRIYALFIPSFRTYDAFINDPHWLDAPLRQNLLSSVKLSCCRQLSSISTVNSSAYSH